MITSSGNMACATSPASGGCTEQELIKLFLAIVKRMDSGSTKREGVSFYSKSNTRTPRVLTGRWRTSTFPSSSGISVKTGLSFAPSKSLNGTTAQLLVLDDPYCERV